MVKSLKIQKLLSLTVMPVNSANQGPELLTPLTLIKRYKCSKVEISTKVWIYLHPLWIPLMKSWLSNLIKCQIKRQVPKLSVQSVRYRCSNSIIQRDRRSVEAKFSLKEELKTSQSLMPPKDWICMKSTATAEVSVSLWALRSQKLPTGKEKKLQPQRKLKK